jgi:antimicrobial peptide system SdpA family protein
LVGLKWALWVLWGSVIAVIAGGSTHESPLRVPYLVRQELIILTPQGWSFFTRNPREDVDTVYVRKADQWRIYSFTNNSLRNWVGVSREARGVGIELAALLLNIRGEQWRKCDITPVTCLTSETLAPVAVDSPSLLEGLCGEVGVVRGPPVPWAWSRRYWKIQMPTKVIRLHVTCGRGR